MVSYILLKLLYGFNGGRKGASVMLKISRREGSSELQSDNEYWRISRFLFMVQFRYWNPRKVECPKSIGFRQNLDKYISNTR